jgi:hypothetical protein
MNNKKFSNSELQEIAIEEMEACNGGSIFIIGCALMLICDAITVGMYYGYRANK